MSYSFATPWTVACQAPLSMGFPRQEYWSGLPFPSSGDLSDEGIDPISPALQADSSTESLGKIPVRDISRIYNRNGASQAVLVVKNPSASAGRRCKRG